MEAREGKISGVTVIGADEPSTYYVGARTENSTQAAAASAVVAPPASMGMAGTIGKKKRSRPRKYGPDGAPISSWVPAAERQGGRRGWPIGSQNGQQHHQVGLDNLGEYTGFPSGANFTTHLMTVNAGEDVTTKIISFSLLQTRAICIVAAAGSISYVTLSIPDSSGATSTFEGRFNIFSLSGSFTPTETVGSRFSRIGGMSISFSWAGGPWLGGLLEGPCIAASPVQVLVASFLPNSHHELMPNTGSKEAATTPGSVAFFHTSDAEKEGFNSEKQQNSAVQEQNFDPPSSFTDNWATFRALQDLRKSTTDMDVSFQGEKSDGSD